MSKPIYAYLYVEFVLIYVSNTIEKTVKIW